ncbi:RNA polymerase sigma factor [Paenibacillus faecis]|uniref:RNA polymerase sigma factor n=1 Tax=Paenibacillus faecis TaxID=862114 RepID=UPI0020119691|nr:sigma-70 family RNA polymerase sigma factor [Paenibacillus faecis]
MDKRTTVDANREERRALIDEWARQAQAGSQEAFIKITRHFERQLYIYCYYLIKDPEETKDALQDIFIRAYRNIGEYRGASFSAWLYRIAYTHSMNVLKKKKREQRLADRYRDEARLYTHTERDSAVMELLEPLTPDERNLVLLKAVEQYSFEEIGQIMDCTAVGLRKKYERIRKKLVQYERNKGGAKIETNIGSSRAGY